MKKSNTGKRRRCRGAAAELVARVRAVLRRRSRPERDVVHFDDLVVNRIAQNGSKLFPY